MGRGKGRSKDDKGSKDQHKSERCENTDKDDDKMKCFFHNQSVLTCEGCMRFNDWLQKEKKEGHDFTEWMAETDD